jgi:hypothetical protein
MVNVEPEGPLNKFVSKIKLPKLSPFQVDSPCNKIEKCGLVLNSLETDRLMYKKLGCGLMSPDEIPNLFSFLQENGYQIETQLTNMMNNSSIKLSNKKFCFSVTYYGDSKPNIMYIR